MSPQDIFSAELIYDSFFVSSCENKFVAFNQKPVIYSTYFFSEVYEEKENVTLLFECLWPVMFDKPEIVSFVL